MSRIPCRCLHCGEVVLYDPELSSNLNWATGCTHPSGLHACADPITRERLLAAAPARPITSREHRIIADAEERLPGRRR